MPRLRPLIEIADDETAIAALLGDILTDEGYDTLCYSSGAEAYRAILREHPDLVILDIQMERYDSGLQVLAKMRSNPATEQIPVIIYSANSPLLRAKEQELRAQHSEILDKPFRLEQLLEKVDTLLSPAVG